SFFLSSGPMALCSAFGDTWLVVPQMSWTLIFNGAAGALNAANAMRTKTKTLSMMLPLPKGEGRGEGERALESPDSRSFAIGSVIPALFEVISEFIFRRIR